MASAKNLFIAGDYQGKAIVIKGGKLVTPLGLINKLWLDKTTVESYEVLTDEHKKSAASGVARGIVGGALLGPIGALAGASSGKVKGIYQVAIQFKDGKKSLVEIDEKRYKLLVKNCF